MAQNDPKLENGTPPTVFELGPSNFQGLSTYPRPDVPNFSFGAPHFFQNF